MAKAAARNQVGPAPRVHMEQAQREAVGVAEDIGLLQDTMVRAPLKKLPNVWSPRFWRYFWALFKNKASSLYSRSVYNRIISNSKWAIVRFLPADSFNHGQLKKTAAKLYERIYLAYAERDVATIRRFCLPPLAGSFQKRIVSRGAGKLQWSMKPRSLRVMSHRASVLGEEQDQNSTAYRQVVVRIESMQTLKSIASGSQSHAKPLRDDPKKVVEYIVLQRRIVEGKEDDQWKVWGFAEESTPTKMLEDEAYWQQMLSHQARATA